MKNSGIKLADLNPRMRAQVDANTVFQYAKPGALATAPLATTGAAFLRQDKAGPNKTEAAFEIYLRAMLDHNVTIIREGVTLHLGNGVRYTPDFYVQFESGTTAFYEVKGFAREDAIVKIKVAARVFNKWKFYLVKAKDRSLRAWNVQEIIE